MLTKKFAAALAVVALILPVLAHANEGAALPPSGNDIRNEASLQRGARNFMNYCSGCHSAKYVRYNRVAADLHIGEAELKQNLMFTSEKPADTIQSALTAADAKKWFGNAPPDLSLIARSRGTSYLYAFLRGFYRDPTRPTGVNNIMLPGTAMPHVLNSLQGVQTAVFKTEDGKAEFEKFELTDKGSMTPAQFDEFVRDTVNFLEYAGEPIEAKRQDLGIWVTLFLLLFAAFSYMLYKDYWRDVH